MKITTISSQRQITIPKELLDALNLNSQDKFLLSVKNKTLIATPVPKRTVRDLAGSLLHTTPVNKRGVSAEKAIAKVKKSIAQKLATKA